MDNQTLSHLAMAISGLVCVALGLGHLPTTFNLGKGVRLLFVIGGGAMAAVAAALFVLNLRSDSNSWYVLNINGGSCLKLSSLQPGSSTPGDLINRHLCRYSSTNAPNATAIYCAQSDLYFYLYPDSGSCEVALTTLREAGFTPGKMNSPPQFP